MIKKTRSRGKGYQERFGSNNQAIVKGNIKRRIREVNESNYDEIYTKEEKNIGDYKKTKFNEEDSPDF